MLQQANMLLCLYLRIHTQEVAEVLLKARAVSSAIGYDLAFASEPILPSDVSNIDDDTPEQKKKKK